ncbi:hypothetical protein [Streptomyces fulvorobeus]|uniref:Vegetative cell wall protein gp1 n=1 Tax=Streptomyces fulvorobeus TaxID=284028 RepID=A0A7J0CFL9_9ACTN|nr:hypothetical protein [Streptomyces fulvorobeus]NYE44503.1 hypothetical protein [Streptomyces fulvorobeus]GFN01038.1 hypothetical protein Sfulv_58480 [Streptomyces fulvorobeus]
MSAFLNALGGKLAERWLALLAIPGLVYLVSLATAVTLGQSQWHDIGRLRTRLDSLAASPGANSAGAIAVAAVAVLAGAALTGTVAQAAGALIEKVWLMDARGPLSRRLTRRRVRRWRAADAEYRSALVAAGRARIGGAADAAALTEEAELRYAARNRISLVPPRHPLWAGDRITGPDRRVWRAYRLDLTLAWPHLWLLAPDTTRAELTAARTALSAAARLTAWGSAYLLLSAWWWPAALIGAATVATGVLRGRTAAASFAELAEALADLHGRDLAVAVGMECEGRLTTTLGESVTRLLSKPD